MRTGTADGESASRLASHFILAGDLDTTALSGEFHLGEVDQLMSEQSIERLVYPISQEDAITEDKILGTQQASRTVGSDILVDLETP